jgi:uncharacterized protein (TIGR03067 family)
VANLMPRSFNAFSRICMAIFLLVCATVACWAVHAWWWGDRGVIRLDQNDPRVLAEHKQLNGKWYFQRSNRDHHCLIYAKFSDGDLTWDEMMPVDYSYRLDPTVEPRKLDWIDQGKVRSKCVYKIDGDTLWLAVAPSGRRPVGPDAFSENDDFHGTWIRFKRSQRRE